MARGYNAQHVTTPGTISVAGQQCYLKRVVVNEQAGGATITLKDGSVTFGVITLAATITATNPFSLDYDLALNTGLTVISTGTIDATVVWGPQGEF